MPIIVICWIKFTRFYPKPFPAPGGRIEYCREKIKTLNPDKPEITNYKHQLFKFQITSTKLQINSNIQWPKHPGHFPFRDNIITQLSKSYSSSTCFEFWISVIVICPSTLLRVVSPSTLLRTVSLSNGLSNHLVFVFCYLKIFTAETWTLTPETFIFFFSCLRVLVANLTNL